MWNEDKDKLYSGGYWSLLSNDPSSSPNQSDKKFLTLAENGATLSRTFVNSFWQYL